MLKSEIYKDKKKEWRFRIKAKNGKIICHGEGYKRKNDCLHAIDLLNSNSIYIKQ